MDNMEVIRDCQVKVPILGLQGLTHFVRSQLGLGRIAKIVTLLGEILSWDKHDPGINALLGENLSGNLLSQEFEGF
jgi:hypothetical protein